MILDGIYIKIEDSIKRARAIKEISGAIVENAKVALEGQKFIADYGGIYAGFAVSILMTGKRVSALQKELEESIPKAKVKYLIHNQIKSYGRGNKKKETDVWNGALMALEQDLQ